jgi:hypothetical protein
LIVQINRQTYKQASKQRQIYTNILLYCLKETEHDRLVVSQSVLDLENAEGIVGLHPAASIGTNNVQLTARSQKLFYSPSSCCQNGNAERLEKLLVMLLVTWCTITQNVNVGNLVGAFEEELVGTSWQLGWCEGLLAV